MKLTNLTILAILLLIGSVSCGKLKFVAFKGRHFGFAGIKVRTPKLLGFKHHGLGFGGHGLGGHGHGFGGGGFHSSGYEHHEYHESHHSGGSFGGGGLWGK